MIWSLLLTLLTSILFQPVSTGAVLGEEHVSLPSVPAATPALALDTTSAPLITADAAGVWDPNAHTVVYDGGIDIQKPIASVTKLMTALLRIEQGFDQSEKVTIIPADNDVYGSRLDVTTGAIVDLRGIFFASLVESANNATEALVRYSGMDEATFVARMNERAAELGMHNTNFTDVTGLGAGNTSTVRDLFVLATEAFSHDLIREATSSPTYTIVDERWNTRLTIYNTNSLVWSDLDIVAGKTGFTPLAGGCLVTMVRGDGGKELLTIVLGSENQDTRFSDSRRLTDWAFANTEWR